MRRERVTVEARAGPWPSEPGAWAAFPFPRPGRGHSTPEQFVLSSLCVFHCCQELGEPGVILILKETFCEDLSGQRAGLAWSPWAVLGEGECSAATADASGASGCNNLSTEGRLELVTSAWGQKSRPACPAWPGHPTAQLPPLHLHHLEQGRMSGISVLPGPQQREGRSLWAPVALGLLRTRGTS